METELQPRQILVGMLILLLLPGSLLILIMGISAYLLNRGIHELTDRDGGDTDDN